MAEARGRLIVFEGLDGSGKSTQMKRLYARLESLLGEGSCFLTREPSEGAVGSLARAAVKGEADLEPETLALLFAADRHEHLVKEILPRLDQGIHVLCDRYYFSNFAYQRAVLPMELLEAYNRRSIELGRPDLTVFLDFSPQECAKRIARRKQRDLFEDTDNLIQVRAHFFEAFDYFAGQERIFVAHGLEHKDDTEAMIWDYVHAEVFPEL